jgi:hypothetical protein
MLLPILISADLLLMPQPPWSRRWRLYLLLSAVVVLAAVLRFGAGSPRVDIPFGAELSLDLLARIRMAGDKIVDAAAQILTLPPPFAIAWLAALVLALWRWRAGNGVALFGLAWLAIVIAPYLGFVLGPFARHFHLALVGFALLAAELLGAAWRELAGRWRLAAAGLLGAGVLAWCLRMQMLIEPEVERYRQQGELVRQFLAETVTAVPQAAPGSTFGFYRVGEMRARDGIFVYGLEDALRFLYRDGSLRVLFPELGKAEGVTYHLVYVDGHLWRVGAVP